ncbi:hypothetical protein Tco_0199449 [Tanacetum coccineum]
MVWGGYAVLKSGKTDSITKLNNIPGFVSRKHFVYSKKEKGEKGERKKVKGRRREEKGRKKKKEREEGRKGRREKREMERERGV